MWGLSRHYLKVKHRGKQQTKKTKKQEPTRIENTQERISPTNAIFTLISLTMVDITGPTFPGNTNKAASMRLNQPFTTECTVFATSMGHVDHGPGAPPPSVETGFPMPMVPAPTVAALRPTLPSTLLSLFELVPLPPSRPLKAASSSNGG